jgi:scyllo-inositol 2-dehydrogenase (NADP+)
MKAVLIGLGNQGQKRIKYFKKDLICLVDPFKKRIKYKSIYKVPLNIFDTAILCIPDKKKYKIIKYLAKNKKNIFVEKPLIESHKKLIELKKIIKKNNICYYTAYNHRFEPHIINIKKILKKKIFGKIYRIKSFYGNGTSKLVKNSIWKDQGFGVLPDLGSHLLDILFFLFSYKDYNLKINTLKNFENKSPDFVSFSSKGRPCIDLEATFLSWKNKFNLDIYAEKGSLHLNGLCKWGPSILEIHKRVYPSGSPIIKRKVLSMKDPTWKIEYNFFKNNLKNKINNIDNDIKISKIMNKLYKKNA